MKNPLRTILVLPSLLLCLVLATPITGRGAEPNDSTGYLPAVKAAVIPCTDMIDDGLYKSIQRRTEIALNNGAQYLIYEIDTYGGDLFAAFDISNYFLHEVNPKAHTVAFVTQKAISAGAMISVACKDIIMKENTTIGDCAPIQMGGKLEGVEREKVETVTRSAFVNAANANGYPEALLKAMVTIQIEVYKVKNLQTGKYEFFEGDKLPKDPQVYDINDKEIIDRNTELLTLTASQAVDYGVARAQVKDLAGGLEFLARRDNVTFLPNIPVLTTNWSEEMVRWLNSPTVMGILVMIALLGVYIEFNTPGAVLPAAVAGICFVIIIGSKYLTGMANWLEIAIFITGLLLLAVEVFILPGFGIAGVLGAFCILVGFLGMLVKNPPDKVPWPQTPFEWGQMNNNIIALGSALAAFIVILPFLTKYLPRIPIARKLMLAAPMQSAAAPDSGVPMPSENPLVEIGQKGVTISQLRPSGIARFGQERINVVSRGEFIDVNKEIIVADIEGNNIVVKEISKGRGVS